MTNAQRDELLIQIVKEIGSFKEETKKGFLKLEKKIEDTEERLDKKIEDTEEKLDKKFTEMIINTKEELTKKIEDTKVYLKGKIDETGSIAGKLFKETWDKEYKRNTEIDSKIVNINKKLKTK